MIRIKRFHNHFQQAVQRYGRLIFAVGSIDQNRHRLQVAAVFVYDVNRFLYATAASHDILNNQNLFVGLNRISTPQNKCAVFFFQKNKSRAELPRHFLSDHQASHRRGHHGRSLQVAHTIGQLGAELANRVRDLKAATVVAPAMGGLVIGQEVARQLGARFIFLEKENGALVLRRGYTIEPDEKILIVEDVVTRGGRVQEAIDIVHKHGGDLQAVAVLVDRSNGKYQPAVPLHSLLKMVVKTFDPDHLPEDLRGTEGVKPGSN